MISRRAEWLLVLGILLLAGALRLGRPDLTEFKRDEAALYGLALDVAEFRDLPLRGIGSSVGAPNTAVSVYLFALPLLAWKSPLAATLFVGLLNTASVGLGYALARRYWGWRPAALAALLYAAAPWAVLYSRKIWAQNLLPLFVVAAVFTALLALAEGRRRWLVPHLALLALVAQIHYSGLLLVPLTGLLLVIFRRKVDGRMLGLGLLAAAALAAPFAWYLAGRTGDTGALAGLLQLAGRPATLTGDSLWLAALVTLGLEFHSSAGPQAFRDFLATVPDFTPLQALAGAWILAGLALVAARLRRGGLDDPGNAAGLAVAVWAALPLAAFLRHATPVFPHYFILLFPAPYLLAAVALDAALRRWPRRWQAAGIWAFAGSLAASQAWLVAALVAFVGARATPGGFGVPLGMLLEAAGRVRAAPDVLVLSDGADPGVDEVPAVFDVLLRGTPVRFVDARTTAVLPPGPAEVLIWPGAHPYPGAGLYPIDDRLPLRQGEGRVLISHWTGQQPAVPSPLPASALLANGAEILGSSGAGDTWAAWWLAPAGEAGEGYTLFAHLLDSAGARVAQADRPTYATSGWRSGDLVVSWLPLPGKGVAVRLGMYATQSLTPVDVLDAAGNAAGPWLELPAAGR